MNKKQYLCETIIKQGDIPEFKDYASIDWILYYIEHYAGIDGNHHKAWVSDQIVRIIKGTKIIIKKATWSDGQYEYRVSTGKPSKEYKDWVIDMKKGIDGVGHL